MIHQSSNIRELLGTRILVIDGAMGTMLQQENLTAADFGGTQLEGCNENLVLTRPDVVLFIHRKYLDAGADIIETNSFGGTPLVLAEYGLGDQAYEMNRRAAELARQAADELSTPAKPRFVAGAMGPTTKAISVTASAEDVMLRYLRNLDTSNITGGLDRKVSQVQASEAFINLTCEDAGVPQPMKGQMESAQTGV
jgi:5-methyltetrahydrofolate--homocysteine methyltransferase